MLMCAPNLGHQQYIKEKSITLERGEMFYNSHKNKEKKAIPSSYMHGINDSVNVEN